MSKKARLTIAHNLFLSREQRYAMSKPKNILEVKGVSIPVWRLNKNTSEPAKEIFCNYMLVNGGEKFVVRFNKTGYSMNLPIKKCKDLLDLRDGGRLGIMFTQHDKIKKLGKLCSVLHYVSIQDESILNDSMDNL